MTVTSAITLILLLAFWAYLTAGILKPECSISGDRSRED